MELILTSEVGRGGKHNLPVLQCPNSLRVKNEGEMPDISTDSCVNCSVKGGTTVLTRESKDLFTCAGVDSCWR